MDEPRIQSRPQTSTRVADDVTI